MKPGTVRQAGVAINWQEVRDRLARAAERAEKAQNPTREEAEAIMVRRARELARVPADASSATEVLQLVTFTRADERYGIEARYVREVRPLTVTPTPIPGTPAQLVGIIALRGEPLAVFDLHALFGMEVQGGASPSQIVALGGSEAVLGLCANSVDELKTVATSQLLPLPASDGMTGQTGCALGVTRDSLIILDGAALLADDRLTIDQSHNVGP